MKKFIFLSLLLTIVRYADIQTTYFSTPDLKTEANPLVSLFGLGWAGLLLAQVILLATVIYALWIYSFKSVQIPVTNKRVSLKSTETSIFQIIFGFFFIFWGLVYSFSL